MLPDGDGWVRCDARHEHWGRFGAAGLLLRSEGQVLLQRRAWWTHHGRTWGVPGGARASWESPEEAALREAVEEMRGADHLLGAVEVDRVHCDDHGGWAYWTVIADIATPFAVAARGAETAEMRWVTVADVTRLPLHPGFAASWEAVAS
ncbi:MAG TPA: NUDIX hydrolase [Mycobacteriales bacterium]|nr:NUDIX hydrolase [Mycobacteriales bacterium]